MKKYIYFINSQFIFLKLINLFKFFLLKNFRLVNPPYLPITMDVEPTTGCNFRCTMCQLSSPGFKSQNMNLETFKNFIDQNKQLLNSKDLASIILNLMEPHWRHANGSIININDGVYS